MIIDCEAQFDLLFSLCAENDSVIVMSVLLDDHNHPVHNNLCALYFYILKTKEEFLLPIEHFDQLYDVSRDRLEDLFNLNSVHWLVINKKNFLYAFKNNKNLIDINLQLYLKSGKQLKIQILSEFINSFYTRLYGKVKKNNYFVPIQKINEYCQSHISLIVDNIDTEFNDKSFKYYNNLVIPVLQQIESVGLSYDKTIFSEFYPDKTNILNKDFLYTQYNIFTSTGRPSNKFGGINYAALNKKTGLRKIFISRFGEQGKLVEFDFDAYHLQLIANEIEYKFPTDINLHTYLGKQYFGKDVLSEEEYQQSKIISFRLLYGGIDKDFESIEYFRLVNIYVSKFWNELNSTGEFTSPIFKRKLYKNNIEGISKYTAWNYFIQLLETEMSILTIYHILDALKNLQSKLVLYTYDGFLFDIHNDEWHEIKLKLQKIFNSDGFHAKIKIGNNYDDLILI